jgi:hypothetical protein
MKQINALKEHLKFYNTLTTNCTTTIWFNSLVNPGHLPEYLYDMGRMDTTIPFAQLQKRSLINSRAQEADHDPDFSRRIREGLPGF